MRSLLFLTLSLTFTSPAFAEGDTKQGEKLFALQIKRLFAEKCIACHGAEESDIKGGLDMRTRESLLAGGETYGSQVLVPNQGRKSFLYLATTRAEAGYEMPPKESEQLTAEQQNWIRQWIDLGAPWPSDETIQQIQNQYSEGKTVSTSGGLSDQWTQRRYQRKDLWAYQPLQVQRVPSDVHPVDWFIDRKLKELHLSPAPNASSRELVRRLSFGLTGLPVNTRPDWSTVAEFTTAYERDPDAAVENYVAELMARPQYGEHFARHWLDVARYADTAGFANDYARPNAWRYRDYVVRAFNDDKPYTRFIEEQIAGDELAPESDENRIATGFLRMGPWEQTGMSVFRVTRQQWLDDVTDSVGQTFLGHALQCAKCHDHKFDPIPTRDYYRMMAVFSTTQFADIDTPFLTTENRTGFKQTRLWLQRKIAAYGMQRDRLAKKIAELKRSETGDAKIGDNGLDPGDENSLARIKKNLSRHNWESDKTEPIAYSVYTGNTIPRVNVNSRLLLPADPWAQGEPESDTILTGGDAYTEGAPVTPGALSAAETLGSMAASEFPTAKGQRRLALAHWITSEGNPLTARVMVNRVWAWHFGTGIAANPNNFGATGKAPSHPALLDYLANWFMKHGWSVKKLNTLILTSRVYRRSSRHPTPDDLLERDPEQISYASFQPRRLTAEEFRDAMLAVSGELNLSVGGVPCRPDINAEVAMQPRQIMGGTASVYEPDPLPKQRNRRSLYAEKIRGLRDPFLELFNQPGPDKSCELRETSIVAPQALTLMNAEEVQDRSLAFAARLLQGATSETQVIDDAFRLALGRSPTAAETRLCLAHWQNCTATEKAVNHTPPQYPTEIVRTVMAEKTGEPYDFVEVMPTFEDYVPDLHPSQCDARTRGLAQLCLVILNMNEFAYLD